LAAVKYSARETGKARDRTGGGSSESKGEGMIKGNKTQSGTARSGERSFNQKKPMGDAG